MALKIKENLQKNASATLRQQGINANIYINRNGKPVPRPITTMSPSQSATRESVPSNNSEDMYSVKGITFYI